MSGNELISKADLERHADKLADLIAQRLNKQPPANKVVWNTEDCADYFKVTKAYFRDCISKRPDFPGCISGVSCKWIKGKVIEWAER